MNNIEVQFLHCKQVENDELQSDGPVAEPVVMTATELMLSLKEVGLNVTLKDLKATVKKLDHKVLVLQVEDITDPKLFHTWFVHPGALTHKGHNDGRPSSLGLLNTSPGTLQ